MTTLAILGGGGHASDVLSIVEARLAAEQGCFGRVLVADDDWERPERFEGRTVEVVHGLSYAIQQSDCFIVGLGYPEPRRSIGEWAAGLGGIAALGMAHPSSDLGESVRLSEGSAVFGQVWVSPNVNLGRHVLVSYGCTIGHDTVVGDYSSIMPGTRLAGDVSVGDGVTIGTGATVLEGLNIGDRAIVGAGAVVTTDVAPGSTVVGIPARPR